MSRLESILKHFLSKTGYKQGPGTDEYEEAVEEGSAAFQKLVLLFYAGTITLLEFESRFKQTLQDHYLRMMILGLGDSREPTERDLAWLQGRIEREYEYLDGFIAELRSGKYSEKKALWRAGMYGFARAAYVNFTVPADVASLMPSLPGDLCYGGSLCGCSLQVEHDSDGNAYVYWLLDPVKESCPACIALAVDSPYIFTREELDAS